MVVVSERLWRTHFRADSAIIGQVLNVNGLPYTVIGIMPRTFDPLLTNSDRWVPAAYTAVQLADHDDHYLSVIGRLKPGVTLAAAQSELNVTAQRLQRQYPIDTKIEVSRNSASNRITPHCLRQYRKSSIGSWKHAKEGNSRARCTGSFSQTDH